jgi:hypothetical protein
VVTRNRQRERENEPHYHQGGEIHRYRLADLASWQDKVYFHVTIPVVEPVPEPPAPKRIEKPITNTSHKVTRTQKGTKQDVMKLKTGCHSTDYYRNRLVTEPPAPKRIEKPITNTSHKVTRTQKATKQRDMKLKTGCHSTDYFKDEMEWRTVSRNVHSISNSLNYYQDSECWRHHYEKEYEGENDPLEA